MDHRTKSRLKSMLTHRINAGRVAVQDQISFFSRHFGQVSSEWKADDTRVTFADFAISENIRRALAADFPQDDYCSEEGNPLDEIVPLNEDFAWVVDPIDGTNNYALGNTFCAISLALLFEGIPIYGWIYDHSTQSLIEGGPDHPLKVNRKALLQNSRNSSQPILGLHFPMDEKQLNTVAELMTEYRVRSLGSAALTITYVATGYLYGAVDYRIRVWDIAAAYALCVAAGVKVAFSEFNPFPLKEFHVKAPLCPIVVGPEDFVDDFCKKLSDPNPEN